MAWPAICYQLNKSTRKNPMKYFRYICGIRVKCIAACVCTGCVRDIGCVANRTRYLCTIRRCCCCCCVFCNFVWHVRLPWWLGCCLEAPRITAAQTNLPICDVRKNRQELYLEMAHVPYGVKINRTFQFEWDALRSEHNLRIYSIYFFYA